MSLYLRNKRSDYTSSSWTKLKLSNDAIKIHRVYNIYLVDKDVYYFNALDIAIKLKKIC